MLESRIDRLRQNLNESLKSAMEARDTHAAAEYDRLQRQDKADDLRKQAGALNPFAGE